MRSLLLCSSLATLLFCLFSASSNAQSSVVKVVPISPGVTDSYAGESIVIVRSANVISMNADGTGTWERTVVVRVQSDAAVRQLGVIAVSFASASERVEFAYARVRRPDGTVTETPGSDALEQPEAVTQQAPFYSDLKQKQLPIKSLRVGDTLEWKATTTTFKAEAPGQFWGAETMADDAVVLEQTYELRVPKSMAVTVWTNPKLGIKPEEFGDGKPGAAGLLLEARKSEADDGERGGCREGNEEEAVVDGGRGARQSGREAAFAGLDDVQELG